MQIGTMRSLRLLYDMQFSPHLDAVGLYELVLEATGDKREAEDACVGRQEQIMRSKHEQQR